MTNQARQGDDGDGWEWASTPPEVWFYPVGNGMHKLNLIVFYRLGWELRALRQTVANETATETAIRFVQPLVWLHKFLIETTDVPFPRTRNAAQALHTYVAKVNENAVQRLASELGDEPMITNPINSKIGMLLQEFEREFEHESRELSVFSVLDKGTHSTTKLLDQSDLNLPEDVRSRLRPESILDVKAAGRCLAFDTPTAAGFHILRAVEPLIVQYRNALVGSSLRSKSRNWGAYIVDLKKHNGDMRVIGMIGHIKDFYRNPIMHPEETLTPDQALSLFHTCLSAIVQLDAATQALAPSVAVP